jgi:6-phosphogluconolactonase
MSLIGKVSCNAGGVKMSEDRFDFDSEFGEIDDQLDLTLYADSAELASEVIAQLLQVIEEGLSERNRFDLALTGGTLGLDISSRLVEVLNQNASDFKGLNIWWSDERFVDAESDQRNAIAIHNKLLNKHVVVHEVLASGNASAEEALSDYEKKLSQVKLDLVILGLGPDGHVASIFPGRADLDNLNKVFLIEDSPKPPAVRISFTMATINSADKVWIVATGEAKADAVTKIIEADLSIPASYVRGSHHTRLIVDTEAFFAE